MKYKLKQTAYAQGVALPKGEYDVYLDAENNEVILTKDEISYKLKATKRQRKAQFRRSSVKMRKVRQEPRWLLLLRIPPIHEWVVNLYQNPSSNIT